jgi:GAF domain-containing protein
MNPLPTQIQALLKSGEPAPVILETTLRQVLQQFRSETGTIHSLDQEKQLLQLAAQVGLPPQMLDIVKTIPVGKGIAGQVAAENRPVTICNLQTDSSGVAKPGARQTGVGGALCVPIRRGDQVLGTFGIGTLREHEYSAAEINALQEIADLVGAGLVFAR